jgi:hypothetical protein
MLLLFLQFHLCLRVVHFLKESLEDKVVIMEKEEWDGVFEVEFFLCHFTFWKEK